MVKGALSDPVTLSISFNDNMEPSFTFKGAWNIQHLGRVRRALLRAFKHYMRDIRLQNKEAANDKRNSE